MDEGLARIFNRETAKADLGTRLIGRKIYAYDWVTSTNDIAHFLAQGRQAEGTIIFAKGQTHGRGRMGKEWASPYGKGLYFSIILRPAISPKEAPRITLTLALAVAEALKKINVEGIAIKWPNDILILGKKVCGILTEMELKDDKIRYVVSGIGVNVNTPVSELPPEATSLKKEYSREFDIAGLSLIIIKSVDYWYGLLNEGQYPQIIQKIKEFSGLILGGRLRVISDNREIEGYAVDFDEYGGLIIRKDNGVLERVSCGRLIQLDAEDAN